MTGARLSDSIRLLSATDHPIPSQIIMKTHVFSLIAAIFGTSLAGHAATIYSQSFPAGSSILPMNTTGVEWNAKRDGATYDPANATATNGPVIGNDGTNRYLFHSNNISDKGRHLWWATDSVFPDTDYDVLTTIDFSLRNSSGSENIKVAIQSGGAWFVSVLNFNSATTNFVAQQLDFTTATWNALNFDTLEVGVAGDPTAGSVTEVGFVSSDIVNSIRIDNVVVAIPEPGVWWLALCGAGLALRRRRPLPSL